jgi:hypothetical protein
VNKLRFNALVIDTQKYFGFAAQLMMTVERIYDPYHFYIRSVVIAKRLIKKTKK